MIPLRSPSRILSILSCLSATVVVLILNSAHGQTVHRSESLGLAPGKVATVRIHGSGLSEAMHLWTPFGELQRAVRDGEGTQSADTKITFTGNIPQTVVPGVWRYRVLNSTSTSSEQKFVVDDLPSHGLADTTEDQRSAPRIPPNVCIDGHLNTAKPRFFRLDLEAGASIAAEVFARRIDSEIDPVLRVLNPDGHEIAYCDDTPGLFGDAQIRVIANEPGPYLLELRDVKHSGGPSHFFHLRVGTFPLIRGTFPRAADTNEVAILGEATDPGTLLRASSGRGFNVAVSAPDAEYSGLTSIYEVEESTFREAEPNDTSASGNTIAPTVRHIAGQFQSPTDVDWYRVSASKGTLVVTALTRELGSPADVVLQLWNDEGKKLFESDDNGNTDAQLVAAVSQPGDYFLSVSELSGQSGIDWTYDLLIDRDGRAEVFTTIDTVLIPKGGTASIPLTVKRIGIKAPLKVNVEGLPDGIRAQPLIISEYQSTAFLTLTAESEIDSFAELSVSCVDTTDNRKTSPIQVTVRRPVDKKSPGPFRCPEIATNLFALTTSPAPFSIRPDSELVKVSLQSTAVIRFTVTTNAAAPSPIEITVADLKNALPPGVSIDKLAITNGTGELTITAAEAARPGVFALNLVGTRKRDKDSETQPVPTIMLEIMNP
ncbi:MAG: PPC domain-containing protein [Planctomycetaceae bacterium]|nr:PPC domain-containing protein [Planctomycetaceae bacterium]